ncbi:MAG: PBP1A family penicillin-binding protein [bacterium]|nr:PBP1A family penicillin-binding protein [bacterium]
MGRKIVVVNSKQKKTKKGGLILKLFISFLGLFSISAFGATFYINQIRKNELQEITRENIYKALYDIKAPTVFLSRDGKISAELFERYREDVKFEEIPKHLVYAFLAAEDEDFFKHKGVDISSILRATIKNILEGKIVQGGSTISQQLARNLFLTREKTIQRKIKEILYAMKIEQELTKEEIFSIYVSIIYFGNGSWGIKPAARNFFNKKLKDLTIAEAALLAALPKSPVYYSPINYPEKARARQMWILERMLELGYISPHEFEKSANEKIKIYVWESKFHKYFWFNEHIRRELVKLVGNEEEIKSGFIVRTTLDEDCYKFAEEALKWGIERAEILNGRKPITSEEKIKITLRPKEVIFPDGLKTYDEKEIFLARIDEITPNGIRITIKDQKRKDNLHPDFSIMRLKVGSEILVKTCPDGKYFCPIPEKVEIEGAIVALDAKTGDVLCMVGGYDWKTSQFIRSIQAQRQIGSAIKPIVYTAAIQSGLYNPATVVKDTPIIFEYETEEGELKEWKPKNIENFSGWITLQEALAKSINAATVRVAEDIGIRIIRQTFGDFGIKAPVEDLTVVLGSISLSPLEVAEIFSTFPNNGIKRKSRFIISVERGNDIVLKTQEESNQIIPPDISFVVTWMMRNSVLYGTGARAKALGIPVAGKTGTTNDLKDAWFVGFTPEIVVVVWIGKDDFTPIGNYGSGPKIAVPIFVEFMRKYMNKIKKSDFEIPNNIEFFRVDPITGEISDDPKSYLMAFTKDNPPASTHQDSTEKKENGLIEF